MINNSYALPLMIGIIEQFHLNGLLKDFYQKLPDEILNDPENVDVSKSKLSRCLRKLAGKKITFDKFLQNLSDTKNKIAENINEILEDLIKKGGNIIDLTARKYNMEIVQFESQKPPKISYPKHKNNNMSFTIYKEKTKYCLLLYKKQIIPEIIEAKKQLLSQLIELNKYEAFLVEKIVKHEKLEKIEIFNAKPLIESGEALKKLEKTHKGLEGKFSSPLKSLFCNLYKKSFNENIQNAISQENIPNKQITAKYCLNCFKQQTAPKILKHFTCGHDFCEDCVKSNCEEILKYAFPIALKCPINICRFIWTRGEQKAINLQPPSKHHYTEDLVI